MHGSLGQGRSRVGLLLQDLSREDVVYLLATASAPRWPCSPKHLTKKNMSAASVIGRTDLDEGAISLSLSTAEHACEVQKSPVTVY